MDNVDHALEQLFSALLSAGPASQGIAWRQLSGPWQQMPRRKRMIAIMTILLNRLDDEAA